MSKPTPLPVDYDSRVDSSNHIERVRVLLGDVISNLQNRADVHDETKLHSPEKECFDKYTPLLRGATYGSDEYRGFLEGMGTALEHHYVHNSHHPEHYANGVYGMSLLDLIEMLVDWKAASERHEDGDLLRSIKINQKRYGFDDHLREILVRTAEELELV